MTYLRSHVLTCTSLALAVLASVLSLAWNDRGMALNALVLLAVFGVSVWLDRRKAAIARNDKTEGENNR